MIGWTMLGLAVAGLILVGLLLDFVSRVHKRRHKRLVKQQRRKHERQMETMRLDHGLSADGKALRPNRDIALDEYDGIEVYGETEEGELIALGETNHE